MNTDTIKTEAVSAFNTFLSSFILAVATILSTGGTVEWNYAFWGSVLLAAVRVAIKAIVNSFVPVSLGGRKA